MNLLFYIILISIIFLPPISIKANNLDNLHIGTLGFISSLDNVNNIYANPIDKELKKILQNDPFWKDIIFIPIEAKKFVFLEKDEKKIIEINKKYQTDALLFTSIKKYPNEIEITMQIISKIDGKLLVESKLKQLKIYKTKNILSKIHLAYKELKNQFPHTGYVLSRKENQVTINTGEKHRLVPGQILDVIQIIKINRHPKFHFIVNTQTDLIGKIKLIKIDKKLSFAHIIMEKEKGIIKKLSKIRKNEFLQYNINNQSQKNSLLLKQSSYQKPSFGKISLLPGIGNLKNSIKIDNNSYSKSDPFYPLINLNGELWLTKNYILELNLYNGIAEIANPQSNSSPEKISHSISKYYFSLGYNFNTLSALGANFKILLGMGSQEFESEITSPITFSSLRYSGTFLGFEGAFKINELLILGAKYLYFFNSSVKESPISSGKTKSSVNHISIFLIKNLNYKLNLKFDLNFELYQTDFSGSGDRNGVNSSQHLNNFSGGIEYLF